MAHDDLHVVMYKILAYLYDCMKRGKRPDAERVSHTHLGITYAYWCDVLRILVKDGYVEGVAFAAADQTDAAFPVLEAPKITREGVEFMGENTMMHRALEMLKEFKMAAPFV